MPLDKETSDKLKSLSTADLVILRWHLKRRDKQTPPNPLSTIWWLLGGRGCVAVGTPIWDPRNQKYRPIEEMTKPGWVLSTSGPCLSSPSYIKGKEELFEVETSRGDKIRVTKEHKFLTERGYVALKNIEFFDTIISFDPLTINGIKTAEKIIKIESVGAHLFYDIHVPGPNNYLAAGMFHHNSGKTFTAANHIYDYSANLPFVEENETVFVALIGAIYDDVKNTMIEGKALALDTLIATPTGMVPIGDLKDGDVVFGGNGLPCNVVKAWPVRDNRPCYKVVLKGGVEIIADKDHLWLTENFEARVAWSEGRKKTKYGPKTVTTKEMSETLRKQMGSSGSQANHGIRISKIQDSEDIELPLDPYLFGVWLGDGKSNSAEVTTADKEIVEAFALAGFEPRKYNPQYQWGFLGLSKILREMGVFCKKNEKRVPEIYFHGSYNQRLALLQGLMDTDGTISERGQSSFSNGNRVLIEAVIRLASSLGIKPSSPKQAQKKGDINYFPNGKSYAVNDCWVVRFTTTLPVFRLSRKLTRVPNKYRDDNFWYVSEVNPVESVPVRCITVDSPDNTYLITNYHVKTHNSGLLKIIPEEDLLKWNRTNGELSWRVVGPKGQIRTVNCNSYTSEKPDKLRGPNTHLVWIDEYAKFKDANEDPTKAGTTWNNMMLGLRLGTKPHVIVTGTPTDCRLSKYLIAHPSMKMSLMTTLDNRANLPDSFFDELDLMDPTSRTYRQEVLAELIFDNPDAIFTQERIDESRAAIPEDSEIVYKVLGYDPAVSSAVDADECGIVLTAYTPETKEKSAETGGRPRVIKPTHAYILKDLSGHYTPHEQTQLVIQTVLNERVDDLVFEQNQGVEFVMQALEQALKDNTLEYYIRKLPKAKKTDYGIVKRWKVGGVDLNNMSFSFTIYAVHATSQKKLRAEMVSTRYDSGQIHHPMKENPLPTCPIQNCRANLEGQMTGWDPKSSRYSPDRLDAMAYCMLHIFANFMITKSKVTISRPPITQGNSQHQAVKIKPRGRAGIYSAEFDRSAPGDLAERNLIPYLESDHMPRNPYSR